VESGLAAQGIIASRHDRDAVSGEQIRQTFLVEGPAASQTELATQSRRGADEVIACSATTGSNRRPRHIRVEIRKQALLHADPQRQARAKLLGARRRSSALEKLMIRTTFFSKALSKPRPLLQARKAGGWCC